MNIILIGMPGAGKSTVGPLLAQRLSRSFLDTDLVLKDHTGKELKDIVAELGYEAFLRIQEEVILSINIENAIIATGGSVIYTDSVMSFLKSDGKVVFLQQNFDEIENRLQKGRKLAKPGEKGLFELYTERLPLYEKYADITIICENKTVELVVDEIIAEL